MAETNAQNKKWLGWAEKKAIFWIIIALVIGIVVWMFFHSTNQKQSLTQNFNVKEIRDLLQLNVYEQSYTIDNTDSKSAERLGITFTETVKSSAQGRLGFHINLVDSIKTKIIDHGKYMELAGPLELSFNEIDPASISIVKDASWDPSLEVSKDSVLKHLGLKALQDNIPLAMIALKDRGFTLQEKALTRLLGKPVKIIITSWPEPPPVINKIAD